MFRAKGVHAAGVTRCQSLRDPGIFDPFPMVNCRQNLVLLKERFAVKQKRFNVEQIAAVSKQAEAGVPLAELIRRVGISEQTLYLSVEEAVRWIGGRPGSSGPTHCVFSVHELARRYNTTPVRHRREIGLAFSGSRPFRVLKGLCFAFSLDRQVVLMT